MRRTSARPPQTRRLPRWRPELQARGASPARLAIRRRSSSSQLGQAGDQNGGEGGADAGNSDQAALVLGEGGAGVDHGR